MDNRVLEEKKLDRLKIYSILICWDDKYSSKIGDAIIRLSKIKLLNYYFPNAKISINCPSPMVESIARNFPGIEKVFKQSVDNIAFNDFDLLFLLVKDRRKYLEGISSYLENKQVVNFRVLELGELEESEEIGEKEIGILHLSDLYATENPPAYLVSDIKRNEIWLSQEELDEGSKFLDQYIKNEKLIIFHINAASYQKTLKMSVTVALIEYFRTLPDKKLVLFDPFSDKEAVLQSLGVNFENIVIIKGLPLRKEFAVMADERIEYILGPCTGLMHAASGIYNSLMKRNLRKKVPTMLVYTGKYSPGDDNASLWWGGRLIQCLILTASENGDKKICKLEDMDESQLTSQHNILQCREYTFEILREFLLDNYSLGVPILN